MKFKKTKSGNVRIDLTPEELGYLVAITGKACPLENKEIYPKVDGEVGFRLFLGLYEIITGDEELKPHWQQQSTGSLTFKKWDWIK